MAPVLLDEHWQYQRLGWLHVKLLLLCSFGYGAIVSELFIFLFVQDSLSQQWGLSALQLALSPFFGNIASMCGGLLWGSLSDHLGRKLPFVVSALVCAAGSVASAFAPSYWMWLLLRSAGSFGIGGLVSVDFVYFLEFCPPRHRGKLSSLVTVGGALGLTFTTVIAYFVNRHNDQWREFVLIAAIPIVVISIVRLFVQEEAPHFSLVAQRESQDRDEEAASLLRSKVVPAPSSSTTTTTTSAPPVPLAAHPEVPSVQSGVAVPLAPAAAKKRNRGWEKWRQLCSPVGDQRRTTVGLGLVWVFQAAGYWGVTLFLPSFLGQIGLNIYRTFFLISGAQMVGVIAVVLLIDYAGRLNLLRILLCGTIVCLLLFAFVEEPSWLRTVFCVSIYLFLPPTYAVLWVYTPECFPTSIRGTGMSFANLCFSLPVLYTPFLSGFLSGAESSWIYPCVWAAVFSLELLSAVLVLKRDIKGKNLQEHLHHDVLGEELPKGTAGDRSLAGGAPSSASPARKD